MAFKSEAHRRWWFANNCGGGVPASSGLSSEQVQREVDAENAYVETPQERENARRKEIQKEHDAMSFDRG